MPRNWGARRDQEIPGIAGGATKNRKGRKPVRQTGWAAMSLSGSPGYTQMTAGELRQAGQLQKMVVAE